jgi:asparagine synthase (glutamine-hydrolysing)
MIGNTRLSIIDVAHGQQPVFSDDKRVAAVQNGEIYNYVELREELKAKGYEFHTDSDTEVILRMYEAHGVSFVSKLNGMFAIAIWDARMQQLHLFRDRIGIKPLFFSPQQYGVAFASEIKALLATGIEVKPSMEAMHHYLSFNYVPAVTTMFEGVEQLQPGWAATISASGMRGWQWWQPSLATEKRSEAQWSEALLSTLTDAVRIHLRSDVEVGAFLSGGVDSSSVVALAADFIKPPMHSFSIGFDEARFDESAYAAEVAAQYHTQHHLERVRADMTHLWPKAIYHCEQPHGDASFMPTYLVSELASRKVKVVVTGDGGDELFAGYERYGAFMTAGEDHFEARYFANQGLLTHAEKLALYTPKWREDLADVDSAALMAEDFAECEGLDVVNRMLWMDMKWLLPGNNLVKPDRMGMAVGLEARVPFLDNRMIALALSMPGEFKLKNGVTKHVLKEAMKGHLSSTILHRPKQMFTVPIGEWFKTHLAGYMREMLASDRAEARGIFDMEAVGRMMDEHIAGVKNHTRALRALVALEHWFRIFVDGEAS